jgi:hypothetical protein
MEYGVVWAADLVWALCRRGKFLAAAGDTDMAEKLLWLRFKLNGYISTHKWV